jgi:hypothetical protein
VRQNRRCSRSTCGPIRPSRSRAPGDASSCIAGCSTSVRAVFTHWTR